MVEKFQCPLQRGNWVWNSNICCISYDNQCCWSDANYASSEGVKIRKIQFRFDTDKYFKYEKNHKKILLINPSLHGLWLYIIHMNSLILKKVCSDGGGGGGQ